jgi:methionine-rich copper-binding protein CopC
MKTFAACMMVLLSLATGAQAATAHSPVAAVDPASGFTCNRRPLERIAFRAAPCCSGLLSCPQLLSNTGLVKPKRSDRT